MTRGFITDFGRPVEMTDGQGQSSFLPRYGVWVWNPNKRRHEVTECGNDLEALRARYGADLEVVQIVNKGDT
jgi:hypothetical protein